MRCVITRVLPEPAPASTRSGPVLCSTAFGCAGFSVLIETHLQARLRARLKGQLHESSRMLRRAHEKLLPLAKTRTSLCAISRFSPSLVAVARRPRRRRPLRSPLRWRKTRASTPARFPSRRIWWSRRASRSLRRSRKSWEVGPTCRCPAPTTSQGSSPISTSDRSSISTRRSMSRSSSKDTATHLKPAYAVAVGVKQGASLASSPRLNPRRSEAESSSSRCAANTRTAATATATRTTRTTARGFARSFPPQARRPSARVRMSEGSLAELGPYLARTAPRTQLPVGSPRRSEARSASLHAGAGAPVHSDARGQRALRKVKTAKRFAISSMRRSETASTHPSISIA